MWWTRSNHPEARPRGPWRCHPGVVCPAGRRVGPRPRGPWSEETRWPTRAPASRHPTTGVRQVPDVLTGGRGDDARVEIASRSRQATATTHSAAPGDSGLAFTICGPPSIDRCGKDSHVRTRRHPGMAPLSFARSGPPSGHVSRQASGPRDSGPAGRNRKHRRCRGTGGRQPDRGCPHIRTRGLRCHRR